MDSPARKVLLSAEGSAMSEAPKSFIVGNVECSPPSCARSGAGRGGGGGESVGMLLGSCTVTSGGTKERREEGLEEKKVNRQMEVDAPAAGAAGIGGRIASDDADAEIEVS